MLDKDYVWIVLIVLDKENMYMGFVFVCFDIFEIFFFIMFCDGKLIYYY